jgi:hypothetical protein
MNTSEDNKNKEANAPPEGEEQKPKSVDLFTWRASVTNEQQATAEAFMKRMLEGDNIEKEFKKVKMTIPEPSGVGPRLASIRKNSARALTDWEIQRLALRKPRMDEELQPNQRAVDVLDQSQASRLSEGLEPSRYVVPVELCYVEADDDPDDNCFLFVFGRAYVISTASPWFEDICQRESEALRRITTNPVTGDPDRRMIDILDDAIYSRFSDLPPEVRPYLYPKLAFFSFLEVCMGGYNGVRDYMNCCVNAYQFAVEVAYLIAINFDYKMADYVVDCEIGDISYDTRSPEAKAAATCSFSSLLYPPPPSVLLSSPAPPSDEPSPCASIVANDRDLNRILEETEAAIAAKNDGSLRRPVSIYDHREVIGPREKRLAELAELDGEDGKANHYPIQPTRLYTAEAAEERKRAQQDRANESTFVKFIQEMLRIAESKVPLYVQADPKVTETRLKRLVCSIPFFLERKMIAMEEILIHYSHLTTYSTKFNPRTAMGLYHLMAFFTDTHMVMLIHFLDSLVCIDDKQADEIYRSDFT